MVDVIDGGKAVAVEVDAADVTAPCDGVAFVEGFVDDVHHCFEGKVVAGAWPPFVGGFDNKPAVEGVMGEAGDG